MSLSAHIELERVGFELDVALDAADGEVVGLLGPNGSGKSTTLRCLAGLESPRAGQITISGTVVEDSATGVDHSPAQRSVGYVFQDYLLFPHLSVVENVAFGPRARGVDRRDAESAARTWLDRLEIADLAARKPSQLSGGQAQRVALARALVTDPDLLLLDEPLAALDAATRTTVRSVLRRHLAEVRGAVVLVTHDPLDAMVLADRVVVLEDGHVVQVGTPADVARRPASSYVASLVGVNLLRGTARTGTVDVGDGVVAVGDRHIAGPVIVAIRPEAISLHRHRPEGSARNIWPGRITSLEARGDLVRVEVDSSPALAAIVTPGAIAELGLHEGGDVWLSVKATDLDVYPA
ncbi:MAG: ABC transporter ATP-binding protein [Candidatus Nanopelagicales bacterium]